MFSDCFLVKCQTLLNPFDFEFLKTDLLSLVWTILKLTVELKNFMCVRGKELFLEEEKLRKTQMRN